MKTRSFVRWAALAVVAAALAGCASQRPVLYPNAKYKQVGEAGAQRDVDECIRLAEQAGAAHGGGERAVREGATGAAVGGVAGAVAGAIGGRNVLDSAAVGAAVGVAAAGTRGAIQSGEPDDIHRNFVQRCLRERGYEVMGWR
jgi:hypothetical protein